MLHSTGRDEDVDLGEEGAERAFPEQLHLHVDQEVFGLFDLSLQEDGARVSVQFPGAEEALLVSSDDADGDVVSGVTGRRSDPENLGGNDDVGLEAELIVCDPDRRVLTV